MNEGTFVSSVLNFFEGEVLEFVGYGDYGISLNPVKKDINKKGMADAFQTYFKQHGYKGA